jgi:hypothetical protein
MRALLAIPMVLVACTPPLPPGLGNDQKDATLTLASFTVAAGEERYVCQDFAAPFGGGETALARFDSHMTAGAHHILVFFKAGAHDGPLESCSGNEFAAGPYGSQRLDDSLSYPSGVAASLPAGTGLRVQAHFLNATQAAITPSVSLKMTRAGDGFSQPAAVLFMSNLDVQVAAGALGAKAQKTCKLPWDVKILQTSGHMHRHGTSFTAVSGARTLFSSDSWTDVPAQGFDPPVELAAGSEVTFTCTYDNPGMTPLSYGESAQTDEMCIFSAQFYPAPFGGWSCF